MSKPTTTVTAPVMEVRDVSMMYGGRGNTVHALDQISFSIADGDFVSLVGPSGCGKSTLLQIIGGSQRSSAGSVMIDGQVVAGPLPGTIAIVFQDPMLLPWKTAAANIEFPLEFQGVPKPERKARAEEMLELVGLAEFGTRYPHELSGGMKQRVALARGLAQRPRILLMDEPFGALDEQTRIKMGRELLRIWDQTRTTVLLVTHSLTEALYLSDTVLVMGRRPGRIIETISVPVGRPRTVEMMGSEVFGHARNRLWALLDQDGDELSSPVHAPL